MEFYPKLMTKQSVQPVRIEFNKIAMQKAQNAYLIGWS